MDIEMLKLLAPQGIGAVICGGMMYIFAQVILPRMFENQKAEIVALVQTMKDGFSEVSNRLDAADLLERKRLIVGYMRQLKEFEANMTLAEARGHAAELFGDDVLTLKGLS